MTPRKREGVLSAWEDEAFDFLQDEKKREAYRKQNDTLSFWFNIVNAVILIMSIWNLVQGTST